MKIIELDETASTNTWVSENRDSLEMPTLVYARSQSAGRGQRGNSWESQPGCNLCASAFFTPDGVEPQLQFAVSEAIALAVVDLLAAYGVESKVKWPNDIYVGNRKICGILIEHAVTPGRILYTIAGMGVNLNQREFLSDAPNPVSLTQITECEYDVAEAAELLSSMIEKRLASICTYPDLHREFLSKLWRGDGGFYPFIDRLRGEQIEARIADIAPDGIITLELTGGDRRSYAFKEIEFILPNHL
ncbi:MAG: biotin--[acetyl-CoA-carboxylase] ligase [Muribaculaceae bacterium]|nr:biotin--[acetyl-CoA-carboxylase] ligase [Muribaculaceae bacterium]